MRYFVETIIDICKEKNIDVLGLLDDHIMRLSKNGRTKSIVAEVFPVNTHTIATLCENKYLLHAFLARYNIPCLEYKLFNVPTVSAASIVTSELMDIKRSVGDIVIKPNRGRCGKGVHCLLADDKITYEVKDAAQSGGEIVATPRLKIDEEYRIILLCGAVKSIYVKHRPKVTGDGISNIEQLLLGKGGEELVSAERPRKNSRFDYVPKKDEDVILEWRHNLHCGAQAEVLNLNDIDTRILDLVYQVSNRLGLSFATVDIIKHNSKYKVLSINCDPTFDIFATQAEYHKEIVRYIYSDVIDMMFAD